MAATAAAATTSTVPSRPLTWLITGASSGFGLSLARCVQAGGHTLVASSRNPSKTPELVSEVESKGGKWIRLDVTDPQSTQIMDNLEASGTHIDVVVNNAGFSIFCPVETTTEKEIRDQMEAMYFGPLRIIKALVPYMRQRRFGVIANISSGASLEGAPTMGPYAGAKAGLDACTRVLAKELAPFNIRTLTVILGTFNTSMSVNAVYGERALPDDYKGTMVDNMIGYLKSGKVPINGDKDKAMKALYEIITATGIGAGNESEKILLLGSDMVSRVKGIIGTYTHTLNVFGRVADNCNVDK